MGFQQQNVPIGTSNTTIVTCPVGQNGSVHGLVFSNQANVAVPISIYLYNQSTGITTLISSSGQVVPLSGQFVWPKPINLSSGDQVIAVAGSASTIIATASVYYNTGVGSIAGFNPKGVWSNVATYAVNDIVTLNGSSYIAVASNTNSQPPSSNWMLNVQQPLTYLDGNGNTVGIQGGNNTIIATDITPITGITYNNDGTINTYIENGVTYTCNYSLGLLQSVSGSNGHTTTYNYSGNVLTGTAYV